MVPLDFKKVTEPWRQKSLAKKCEQFRYRSNNSMIYELSISEEKREFTIHADCVHRSTLHLLGKYRKSLCVVIKNHFLSRVFEGNLSFVAQFIWGMRREENGEGLLSFFLFCCVLPFFSFLPLVSRKNSKQLSDSSGQGCQPTRQEISDSAVLLRPSFYTLERDSRQLCSDVKLQVIIDQS